MRLEGRSFTVGFQSSLTFVGFEVPDKSLVSRMPADGHAENKSMPLTFLQLSDARTHDGKGSRSLFAAKVPHKHLQQ